MEVRGIIGCHILRVDSRIEKADCRLTVGNELLVDQRDITGPHGRSEAGAAIFVRRTRCLVGADVKAEVRVRRHIRAVAKGGGTLVARVDDARKLLPGGNCDFVGSDTAAAIHPSRFRLPGAPGACSYQVRAADGHDVSIVGRPRLVARRPGGRIPGSGKEILSLRGHLLEIGVERAGVRRRPPPRTANGGG